MASGGVSVNVHDHCVCVDKKKSRVRCIYCNKEVGGVTRLKCHLGGVPKDVAPCLLVPDTVREIFRPMMLRANQRRLARRVTRPTYSPHEWELFADSSDSEYCSSEGESLFDVNILPYVGRYDLFMKKDQDKVGRFFYENCIDFSVADSESFRQAFGLMNHEMPTSADLKGWILQKEVKEMEEYVQGIKDSWEITGCSILLDTWVDREGRELVTFIVDCPKGAVYLKSHDVSGIKTDMIALVVMIEEVIEEVGAHNVVQVIGCSVSGWVGEMGKWFVENHRQVFWTVSASHCFGLMLDKIGKMDVVVDVLNGAKNLSRFILEDPSVSGLFGDQSSGKGLVGSSENESVTPYLTLESVVAAKNDLRALLVSPAGKSLISASGEAGKTAAALVDDLSFWNTAEIVRKCTTPLVRLLNWFVTDKKPQMGDMYEKIFDIKDIMAKELTHSKLSYKPFWGAVDEVRDAHLHSPLHAAAYFLNPRSFYKTGFRINREVATGLFLSLIHVVKDQLARAKAMQQLDMYRLGTHSFFEAISFDKIYKTGPAEWWDAYGTQHPELQRFAMKILSQTCEGASRFRLKRSPAEKMIAEGKNPLKRQLLKDFAFVHYNLHLRGFK